MSPAPATLFACVSLGLLLVPGAPGAACAAGAPAQVEIADPRFSLHSPVLVGTSSGAATPEVPGPHIPGNEGFVVEVRDINDVPLYNKPVILEFSGSGLRLAAGQDSGCVVDCAAQTLTGNTAARGYVVFHPRFGGYANQGSVLVLAGGVALGYVPARSTDLDGLGGTTGLGDFALFAPLYARAATDHPEADFDVSGGPVGLGDFAIFAGEYARAAHNASCP